MDRDSGQVELATGMYFLMFLILFLAVQLQLLQFLSTSLYMEDALAASNLASAVIDLESYGETQEIVIGTAEDAFDRYQRALKDNLNLDEDWNYPDQKTVDGRVEIQNYTIYNVSGQDVEIRSFDRDGFHEQTVKNGLGTVHAPNGVRVEATGIYSEIGFPVKGILGIRVSARKGKLVDVIAGM